MLLHAKFVQTSYTQLGQCLKLKRAVLFFVFYGQVNSKHHVQLMMFMPQSDYRLKIPF